MKNVNPPRWVDSFLRWYCDPELLEEIQGDAHELYFERLDHHGKLIADLNYFFDILRFFKRSNIRNDFFIPEEFEPLSIWGFKFKLALRHAQRNKLLFFIKIAGLSICFAFSLILIAFIINETGYDRFHENANRIYRISSRVEFEGQVTTYAVTPFPLGPTFQSDIPDIEQQTRLIYEGKPTLHVAKGEFNNETALVVDTNFLRVFSFPIVSGNSMALQEPNSVVITESLAFKLFGNTDPIGKTILMGQNISLNVDAVIRDVPKNSHLKFEVLIAWDTFSHHDDWNNINAYTYVLLKPSADIESIKMKLEPSLNKINDLVAQGYNASFEPRFEKLTEIHFSEPLEEDIAERSKSTNVYILIQVAFLFLLIGLINYININLAEIGSNLRKIGIIRLFGGYAEKHSKVLSTETFLILLIVCPLVAILTFFSSELANQYLSLEIDTSVFTSNIFMLLAFGFIIILILVARLNASLILKANELVNQIKGRLNSNIGSSGFRKALVVAQLAFSVVMIAIIMIIADQFRFIQESDKGFDAANTIVISVPSGSQTMIETFNASLYKLNNIISSGGSSYAPDVIETRYVFQVETDEGTKEMLLPMIHCGYDYFNTLGMRIVSGRQFDRSNEGDPYNAFVINEAAAKSFGWKESIGRKISGPRDGDGTAFREGEVIGVVKDFNFASLHTRIEPLIIFMSNDDWSDQFVYVKANSSISYTDISSIEKEYHKFWTDTPFNWYYLDSKYQSYYEKDRMIQNMFEIGLVISIVISCLGIFSFSTMMASIQLKEMGIRKVMGANFVQLILLHLQDLIKLTAICILISVPIIYLWSQSWLHNFAYHIGLRFNHFLIPAVLAGVIVLSTSFYHAFKTAKVSPVDVLKNDI